MDKNLFPKTKEYLIKNGFQDRVIYGNPQNRFQKYFNSSLKGYSYIEFDFNNVNNEKFFNITVSLSFNDRKIIDELQNVFNEGNIYKKEVLRLINLEKE